MSKDNQSGSFNQAGSNNRQVINHGNMVGTNHGTMVIGSVGGSVRQVRFGGAGTVNVNGVDIAGSSVEQRNGRTFVDGQDVTDQVGVVAQIIVIVQGNVDKVEAQGCGEVTITGDAGKVKASAGNVRVSGNVGGNVESSAGNIHCGVVNGSVKTSAGNIHFVKAEGDDAGEKGKAKRSEPGFFGRFFGK